jgi:hypothetical protein
MTAKLTRAIALVYRVSHTTTRGMKRLMFFGLHRPS